MLKTQQIIVKKIGVNKKLFKPGLKEKIKIELEKKVFIYEKKKVYTEKDDILLLQDELEDLHLKIMFEYNNNKYLKCNKTSSEIVIRYEENENGCL